ncbi:tumor necrosis factor receptor superfamily member 6 isoform X2 [Latimeria chalumnae]|uniref:tumor necrosis factor receptor superfamily member 6 isoform X2 n=1 Tax=Latimeria chalumnae TaxID=7897 RepID=UPI0006D92DE3|nr:PREDICTED: tumor necrosis factor receptor superfamily member 6 isoform X2 [Latimeria chalumnae]|eukprot:XP_014353263.1 PREDICTED: tumor necrosis factor receptor superfamily member 6 isoform X2 [Latimeria chalumnae]
MGFAFVTRVIFLPLVVTIVSSVGAGKEQNASFIHLYTKRLAKREITCCTHETTTDNRCCKYCPKGHHINETCECEPCDIGTYLDERNCEEKCRRCDTCDLNEGLEEVTACNTIRNVVCQCKENFYCTNTMAESCKECISCDKCKGSPHETICTSVCKLNAGSWWITTLVAVLILVAVAIAVAVGVRKYSLYQKGRNNQVIKRKSDPEVYPMLPDADLRPILQDIADELGINEIKSFVRRNSVNQPVIDRIREEHAAVEEQRYQLMLAWYQQHGRTGAATVLISTLRKMNKNAAADSVLKKLENYSVNQANGSSSNNNVSDS